MSAKLLKISVTAVTKYMESRSDPETNQYAFGYAVTIVNKGDVPVQLLRRHWLIKSDNGNVQEVQGEGVIGEQPRLIPEGTFKYSSWVMLQTPTGHMEGRYLFINDDGFQSWEEVPLLFFEVPGARTVN